MDADVIALQEVHADSVEAAYSAHFQHTHCTAAGRLFNPQGAIAAQLIYVAYGVAGSAVLHGLVLAALSLGSLLLGGDTATLHSSAALFLSAASLLLCYALAVWGLHASTFLNFLTGSTHGGLLLVYRRSAFSLVSSATHTFREQRGDFLNIWRPRAYQISVLQPVVAGRPTLIVCNLHMNLGADDRRERQLDEAVAHAEAAAAAATAATGLPASVVVCGDTNALQHLPSMCGMTSKRGFSDAYADAAPDGAREEEGYTWSAANPLTRGILIEPCGRLDYVFCKTLGPLPLLHTAEASVVLTGAPYVSDHYGLLISFVLGERAVPAADAPFAPPLSALAASVRGGGAGIALDLSILLEDELVAAPTPLTTPSRSTLLLCDDLITPTLRLERSTSTTSTYRYRGRRRDEDNGEGEEGGGRGWAPLLQWRDRSPSGMSLSSSASTTTDSSLEAEEERGAGGETPREADEGLHVHAVQTEAVAAAGGGATLAAL